MRQPRSFSVECDCFGTTCTGIKRSNQGILELAGSALYGKGRLEDSAQTEKLAETSQSLSRQSAGLMVLVKKFSSSGDSEQMPGPRRLSA